MKNNMKSNAVCEYDPLAEAKRRSDIASMLCPWWTQCTSMDREAAVKIAELWLRISDTEAKDSLFKTILDVAKADVTLDTVKEKLVKTHKEDKVKTQEPVLSHYKFRFKCIDVDGIPYGNWKYTTVTAHSEEEARIKINRIHPPRHNKEGKDYQDSIPLVSVKQVWP